MVPLTRAESEFAARVLVAKLGSAGILAEIRGLSSFYPPLSTAQVWVEDDALDDARELIVTDDVFPTFDAEVDTDAERPPSRRLVRAVLVAVALLVLVGLTTRCSTAPSTRHPAARGQLS